MPRSSRSWILVLPLLCVAAPLLAQQATEPLPALLLSIDASVLPDTHTALLPADVAMDEWGNVYIADTARARIYAFDGAGTFLRYWGEDGTHHLDQPTRLDVGPDGRIYVYDAVPRTITVYSDAGVELLYAQDAAWEGVYDLSIAPDGSLYLVVAGPPSGYYVLTPELVQSGPFHYSYPTSPLPTAFDELVAVDFPPEGGTVFVDRQQSELIWNTPSGDWTVWGPGGDVDVALDDPLAVACDPYGAVYVLNEAGDVLDKFAADGTLLSRTPLPGLPLQMSFAFHGSGTLWVSDTEAERVDLYGYPVGAVSVADVPDDQGGRVRLSWEPALHDRRNAPPGVDAYAVYRRLPAKGMEDWDFIATVPARGDTLYNLVAPTLCDSTAAGTCLTEFVVTTLTAYGELFDSDPVFGWSTDDVAPPLLDAPQVAENPGAFELVLDWTASTASDLAWYGVYRGAQPGFEPAAPDQPYAVVGVPGFTDAGVAAGETWYYRVAAFDDAGNCAGYSPAAGALVTTSADDLPGARRPSLDCAPNPFNPRTTIRLSLPEAGPVQLCVFDLTGRRVATLADGPCAAGERDFVWNGVTDAGRACAAGRYVVRAVAGETVLVRGVTLVK